MTKFIISYLGGDHPTTPEEGQKHFQKYKEWMGSLGSAIVSPANPFKNTHVIKPDGTVNAGSESQMSGYTVIEAESMEAALALCKDCPFLEINGTLEVSELAQMNM